MAIITDVVQTKKNAGKMCEIYLDGICIGLMHIEAIAKHRIKR